jgi:photosystem II stability/assembly factor-like uncharacterized protein
LCEQYLISPEGRRLSVEERELLRQLKLPRETLSHLVDRRLLRTDRRSDSTYYELSHDALVQPVLASRRVRAMVFSWASVLAGSVVCLSAAVFILLCSAAMISGTSNATTTYVIFPIFVVLSLFLGAGGLAWFRSGRQRLRRYRRHTASEEDQSLPTLQPLKVRMLGWALLSMGSIVVILWGLVGLFGLIKYGVPIYTDGSVPKWLNWMAADIDTAWPIVHDHPFIEMLWWILEHAVIVLFGWLLFRHGARKLWPYKFTSKRKAVPVPGVDDAPSLFLAIVKGLSGYVALMAAALGFFVLRSCATSWHGIIPSWLTGTIISYRFSDSCQAISLKPDWGTISFVAFFVSLFCLSGVLLRDAVREIRASLRHQQLAEPGRRPQIAIVAATCGVLLIGSIWFWMHIVSRSNERGGMDHQQSAATVNTNPEPWSGWTVGDDATILHTEDGGATWKSQNNGKGMFYSVNFPSRGSGWAVGAGGAIWHSNDGGESWGGQKSGVTTDLTEIVFVGPEFGWAVGDDGTILHTEDAGSTWKKQNSGTNNNLWSLTFVSKQLGWAAGANGTILHTDDGGNSWKSQNSGTVRGLIGLAFATNSAGWAVGQKGTILHTENGGSTWNSQSSGTRLDLMSPTFDSPRSGWIVGRSGIILHTGDGGATWDFEASGAKEDLIDVDFATAQSSWAVGKGGTILHTEDGGNTWMQQKSGATAELQSISIVKPYGVIGLQLKDVPGQGDPRTHVVSAVVHVVSAVPGGPADNAGLKAGDIIFALNGNPVKDTDDVVSGIFVLKPGTYARVSYIRDGKDGMADVIVGDGSRPFASPAPR